MKINPNSNCFYSALGRPHLEPSGYGYYKWVDSLNREQEPNDILKKIKKAEETIEEALWKAVQDFDRQKELETYQQVETLLVSLSGLSPEMERERDRVLAYCLLRIDDTLIRLGAMDNDAALERTREALETAERSEDQTQIARCALAYGTRLLNAERLPEAEEQFSRVILMAEEHPDNEDIQQVLGWAFLVRAHILLGKSLYDQAIHVLKEAIAVLAPIKNYAGLARANKLMAQTYTSLGDKPSADECRARAKEYHEKAKQERR